MTRPTLELRTGGRSRQRANAKIKTCASVHDPRVILQTEHIQEQLIVVIEEGSALIELTFPDPEAVERFKRRVALLPVHLVMGVRQNG